MAFAPLSLAESGGGEAEGGGEKKLSDAHIDNEYKRITIQQSQEESKIREGRKRIKELIHARNESRNENEKKELNKKMAEIHRSMTGSLQRMLEYTSKKKYRFPEKDDETERHYYPERVESLEQMEREVGLEAELTQIKQHIRKVYSPFLSTEFKAEEELAEVKKPATAERSPASHEPKKGRLQLIK